VISGGDEYLFSDNVILTRVKTKKKREMKLFTDQLDILPNLDIILTKKPVKIIQEPSIEIYGVGMKYDNKEGIVKLLSNVRVHYDNPSK
jgi:LPS export ABC transporter protein LptC